MMVNALVTDKESMQVTFAPKATGTVVFRFVALPRDRGKVIGEYRRTVRSLRIILLRHRQGYGQSYVLNSDGLRGVPEEEQ